MARRSEQAKAWLAHRRAPLMIAALAVALASPVLATGFQIDDYHDYSWALNDPLGLLKRPEITPESLAAAQARGHMPWWASPDVRPPAQVRPLGAVGLWIDLRLWPDDPLPKHAHSLLMYFLLTLAVGALYRELHGATWLAGLATLMYAIDDAASMSAPTMSAPPSTTRTASPSATSTGAPV